MSHENRTRSSSRSVQTREHQEASRSSVAPGKRTLTQGLPGRRAGARAPAQQKPDPSAVAQRKERAALTDRWLDTAMRPDLHPPPAQRKGANEGANQASPLPASGSGKPMPGEVQAKMGQAFGAALSGVRIHEGPQAASIGALAYTQGTDIHFAPGQYSPHSRGGQELLGHELAHVVQQAQGRVVPTTQAKGVDLNADASLEREADVQGARAARGERVNGAAGGAAVATVQASSSAPVQRMVDPGARPETPVIITLGDGRFATGVIVEEVSGGYMVEHDKGKDFFPYIALNLENPRVIDGGLGTNKWREGVRGKDQNMGVTAYDDEGTKYGRTLPEGQSYSTSIHKAQAIVSETLGMELTPELIEAIHHQSTEHLSHTPDWRNKRSGEDYDGRIGIGLLDEHFEPEGAEELAREPSKPMTYYGARGGGSSRPEHRLGTRAMSTEEVQDALGQILATYKERIARARNREEVFDSIAQFSQSLARLHPFEDANTRTNMLLLNKLLVENGFPPSIVHDPKHFYLNTLESWKVKILEGMDTWYEHGGRGGEKPTGEGHARDEEEVEVRPITDILSAKELEELGPLQVEDPIRAIERQVIELNQLFTLYAELVARASEVTDRVETNVEQTSANTRSTLEKLGH